MSPGFTLLEVLAAVAIISIALVGIYRLYSQTITMNQHARFYTMAPLLARQQAARLALTPDHMEEAGDFGTDFPGYTWKVVTSEVESEYLGEAARDLAKIDITIAFHGGEFSSHFSYYEYRPEGEE